jgi:hypothetical protein
MARSRAFRWGEDGIAGVCDSHGLQNVAFAFWNGEEYVIAPSGCLWCSDVSSVTSSRSVCSVCPTLRVTTASR